MKMSIELRSNGIHDFMELIITNPEIINLSIIEEIIKLVDKYNREQIEKA